METVVPESAVYGYKKTGHRTNSLFNRISDSPNHNLLGRQGNMVSLANNMKTGLFL